MRKELEENPSDPSVISKVMQAVLWYEFNLN